MEKLRLTEEEVFTLRRNLNQSRRAMCGMESDARDLGNELDKCQVELQGSADECCGHRKHSMALANLISLARRLSFGFSQLYLTVVQLMSKVPGLAPLLP